MTAAGTEPVRRIYFPQLALVLPWIRIVLGAFRPIRDNSFLWHVAAGRLQVELGSVLVADPFSFTMAGEAWRTQSWLADVLYAWIEDSVGMAGYAWMLLLAGALAHAGIGLIVWRVTRNPLPTAVVLLLSFPVLAAVQVPRPVLFTFPLFALTILVWDDRRLRWALPFVMWLWASVHGSFFLGLVYVGARILARREWRSFIALFVAGLATLLTAHGLGIVEIVLEFLTLREHLAYITEWATPDFLTIEGAPFMIGLVLIVVGAIRGRIGMADLWVFVPFLVLALSASRAIAPAWIALVPLVGAACAWRRDRIGNGFPIPVALCVVVLVLVGPILLAKTVELDGTRFPLVAAQYLDPDKLTYHDDVAGGYLIYAGTLGDGVFIDDRVELFRDRIGEFVRLRAGREDWRAVFDRDGIEQALVRKDDPLRELLEEAGWRTYFADSNYAILRPE
jgi:hypothetical protein|nr:MAG: hypothetical protein DIU67_01535 [Actinomycetota bacterium]